VTDRGARRRAELRLIADTERAEAPPLDPASLLDPADRPEPDPGPWRGATEGGRRAMRRARAALDAARSWEPPPRDRG
jgi:hypothetical protein